MATDELQNLDKNIQRLKEQLAGKRDILVTIAPEEQVRIEQQIEDLRRLIRDFEREKWDLVALCVLCFSVVPSTPSPAGLYLRIHFTHQT